MATLRDIAQEAGFSIGTVSKVLNSRHGNQSFSRECVGKIRTAARKLGYRPNYHARSLQGGRSQTIGVLVGGVMRCAYSHFWSQMIGGIMATAREMHYHTLVVGELEDEAPFELGLRFLEERRVDALIALPLVSLPDTPCPYAEAPGPVVLTAQSSNSDWPTVGLDEEAGIAAAVRHLADLGHRRILWAGPRQHRDPSVARRRAAFQATAEESGLETEEVLMDYIASDTPGFFGRRVEMQRQNMLEFLQGGSRATGCVCYEESTAFGVMSACVAHGLRVPEDMSVIGFDDIYAQTTWPQMTVVSHMLEQMACRAAQIAVDMAEKGVRSEFGAGYTETIPAELVVRASTGPAPDSPGTR